MHQVHFLEVFHAGCYLRGHVDQRAETATGRTRGGFQKFCTTKLVCVCMCVCIPDVYTQRGIGSPQMTTVWKYVRMDRPFALTKELAWMALLSKIPVDESWMTVVLMGLFLMVCTMILRFSSVLGNKIRNNENCSKKIVLESCIPLFFRRRLFFLIRSILYSRIIEYYNNNIKKIFYILYFRFQN